MNAKFYLKITDDQVISKSSGGQERNTCTVCYLCCSLDFIHEVVKSSWYKVQYNTNNKYINNTVLSQDLLVMKKL